MYQSVSPTIRFLITVQIDIRGGIRRPILYLPSLAEILAYINRIRCHPPRLFRFDAVIIRQCSPELILTRFQFVLIAKE